jgi:hypothetical protein
MLARKHGQPSLIDALAAAHDLLGEVAGEFERLSHGVQP